MIRLQKSLMKGTAIHLGEIVSNSDPKSEKIRYVRLKSGTGRKMK